MKNVKNTTYDLPDFLQKKWSLTLLIFIVAFGIYSNTLGHSFTQDDAIVIYENIYVKNGISGIKKIFTTDSFSGFFKGDDKSDLVSGGRYRPMTLGVFALIYELFGSSTFVFHLFNVLMYTILCIVLFQILVKLKTSWLEKKQLYFALIATLIFAVHPVHTEVVANVKGLDEIFSLLFSLLSLQFCFYLQKTRKPIYVLLIVIFFISALLSKENAAAFVIIIPLTLYFFTDKKVTSKFYNILLPSFLIFGSFILYWIIRSEIVGGIFGNPPLELMNNPFIKISDGRYIPFSFEERWASIFYGMGKYIQLLFFPHPLTHDYYPRHFGIVSFANASVWLSIIMNISLGLIALTGIRKRSLISYSIFFFYFTIALVSNVVFPIGTHISERFLFTPSISIALVVALIITQLKEYRKYRLISLGLFLIIMILGSLKTLYRNNVWKDDLTLFTSDVNTSKNSAKVRNAAGGALLSAAILELNELEKTAMINTALVHLQEAIKIHPNYKEAHLLLGNGHSYLKNYDQSIRSYDNALRINNSYEQARENLLIVLREGAREEGAIHRNYNKAITYLERAIKLEPDDFSSLSLLGTAYGSSGNHRQAIIYFEKAIKINPKIATTYMNLGYAQLKIGLEDDAQINFNKAAQLDPNVFDKNQR